MKNAETRLSMNEAPFVLSTVFTAGQVSGPLKLTPISALRGFRRHGTRVDGRISALLGENKFWSSPVGAAFFAIYERSL